jgi:hypothetical protein
MTNDTRREKMALAVTLALVMAFVVLISWYLIELFAGPNPRDPLTKAGGLSPDQDIHRQVN